MSDKKPTVEERIDAGLKGAAWGAYSGVCVGGPAGVVLGPVAAFGGGLIGAVAGAIMGASDPDSMKPDNTW